MIYSTRVLSQEGDYCKLVIKRKTGILFAVVAIFLSVLACTCNYSLPDLSQYLPNTGPTPVIVQGSASGPSTACPSPGTVEMPPFSPPAESLILPAVMGDALLMADIPPFDPYEWEAREGSIPYDVPRTVTTQTYQVGDVETFMVGDRWTQIDAELVAMSEHAYFWVEAGHVGDRSAYERAAELLEEAYSVEHRYFGSEWYPGVDNDPRLFVLHATDLEGVLGFFSPPDQTTQAVDESSNQHEMFYMNLDTVGQIGGDLYMATLTHEFQHMIQANTDPNEANWVDEGLAQMAELLTGYPGHAEDRVYLRHTDTPLNFWDYYGDDGPSYASNFLFWLYLWEQFGDDVFIQAAQSSREGLMAVEETLRAYGSGRSVYEVFSDWTVANLVDEVTIGDGRYGYDNFEAGSVCPLRLIDPIPSTEQSVAIDQFTPHYYQLNAGSHYNIDFDGQAVAQLVPAQAHSGLGFWWANRRDGSHTRLMREFDLAGLGSATLRYSLWYDAEACCDALFVSASTDGGATWDILFGDRMLGSVEAYGLLSGYSGSTGTWITDEVDLTPYAGRPVLISFDHVTDLNYTLHGFALDDIEVPELGFYDDAETRDEGWQAEGWVWTGNQVPQYWGVYVIALGNQATVIPFPVQDGRAHVEGDLPSGTTEAYLVIAASAPITRVPAVYTLGPAQ